MLTMQLRCSFGPYQAGSVLWFMRATQKEVSAGDVVLCGLNEEELFPHLVLPNGELSNFGFIVGEHENIRYKTIMITAAT